MREKTRKLGIAYILILSATLFFLQIYFQLTSLGSRFFLHVNFLPYTVPIVASIILFYWGVRLYNKKASSMYVERVGVWVTIFSFFAFIGSMSIISFQTNFNIQLRGVGLIYTNNVSLGAMTGFLMGKYDAQMKSESEKFRFFFHSLGDPVFVVSREDERYGEIIEINERATKITGYTKEELIGMDIHDLLVEEPEQMTAKELRNELEAGKTLSITTKHKTKKGDYFWTEESLVPISYRGEDAVISVYRDISERIKAQQREELMYSLLTHDIRNKSQVVLGNLEMIKDQIKSDLREKIENATEALKQTLDLADKVKKIVRLRRGLNITTINEEKLKEHLESAIDRNRGKADKKDIKIEKRNRDSKGKRRLVSRRSRVQSNSKLHHPCTMQKNQINH